MHRGTIGCGVSKMWRLSTNHNASLQILIFIGDPVRRDSLQLSHREAARLSSGSVEPALHICGEVFHARSYRTLTRPMFQIFVAFNAASSSAVLAVPPRFLGVTATLFPSFPML